MHRFHSFQRKFVGACKFGMLVCCYAGGGAVYRYGRYRYAWYASMVVCKKKGGKEGRGGGGSVYLLLVCWYVGLRADWFTGIILFLVI